MRIDGSAALVAGGASGLGEATVRYLHDAGARGEIADVNAQRREALAAELGEGASFALTDVTQPDTVQSAVAEAVAQSAGDGLRISVCCAGIGHGERIAGRRGAPP